MKLLLFFLISTNLFSFNKPDDQIMGGYVEPAGVINNGRIIFSALSTDSSFLVLLSSINNKSVISFWDKNRNLIYEFPSTRGIYLSNVLFSEDNKCIIFCYIDLLNENKCDVMLCDVYLMQENKKEYFIEKIEELNNIFSLVFFDKIESKNIFNVLIKEDSNYTLKQVIINGNLIEENNLYYFSNKLSKTANFFFENKEKLLVININENNRLIKETLNIDLCEIKSFDTKTYTYLGIENINSIKYMGHFQVDPFTKNFCFVGKYENNEFLFISQQNKIKVIPIIDDHDTIIFNNNNIFILIGGDIHTVVNDEITLWQKPVMNGDCRMNLDIRDMKLSDDGKIIVVVLAEDINSDDVIELWDRYNTKVITSIAHKNEACLTENFAKKLNTSCANKAINSRIKNIYFNNSSTSIIFHNKEGISFWNIHLVTQKGLQKRLFLDNYLTQPKFNKVTGEKRKQENKIDENSKVPKYF